MLFIHNGFLQCLPTIIRMQLAEDRHSLVQALAARADAIMVHHQAKAITPVQLKDRQELVTAISSGKGLVKEGKGKKPWERMGI